MEYVFKSELNLKVQYKVRVQVSYTGQTDVEQDAYIKLWTVASVPLTRVWK